MPTGRYLATHLALRPTDGIFGKDTVLDLPCTPTPEATGRHIGILGEQPRHRRVQRLQESCCELLTGRTLSPLPPLFLPVAASPEFSPATQIAIRHIRPPEEGAALPSSTIELPAQLLRIDLRVPEVCRSLDRHRCIQPTSRMRRRMPTRRRIRALSQ